MSEAYNPATDVDEPADHVLDPIMDALMDELCVPVAPGVDAFVKDHGPIFELAGIRASIPGRGHVAAYLDSLPTDREVIVPFVTSAKLRGMLHRRGFTSPYAYEHPVMGFITGHEVWVRPAVTGAGQDGADVPR